MAATTMTNADTTRVGLELFDDDDRGSSTNSNNNGPLRRRILLSLGEHLLTERRGEAALAVFLSARGTPCERRGHECGVSMRGLGLYFTFAVEWGEEEEEKGEGGEIKEDEDDYDDYYHDDDENEGRRRRRKATVAAEIAEEIIAGTTAGRAGRDAAGGRRERA